MLKLSALACSLLNRYIRMTYLYNRVTKTHFLCNQKLALYDVDP